MPVLEPTPTFGTYRQQGSDLSPPWLAGPTGERLVFSLSIQLDALAEYLRLGVLQRMPGQCRPEALPAIGADRHLLRGQQETDEAYTFRLQNAWQTWKRAGTPKAVLDQIASYYSPSPPVVRYVVNGFDDSGTWADWWTLANGVFSYQRVSPSNWDWDGTYPTGRFWIIVYVQTLLAWQVGDGHVVGGGQSVGFEGDGKFVADLRSLIGVWKAAGSHAGTFDLSCDAGLILAGDTTQAHVEVGAFNVGDGTTVGMTVTVGLFDPSLPPGSPMPDGTWNEPGNRDPGAVYLSGI